MSDPISAGLLILRLTLAVVFLAHGVKHLLGRTRTTAWFASIGFRAPGFQWFASTMTELGVGVLLIAGALTSLAAAGLVAVMFIAFWTVHRRAGFFITSFMKEGVEVEGYEFVASLAFAAVALAVAGPGEYSLDAQVTVSGTTVAALLDGWVGLAIVGGAIVVALAQIAAFWRPGSLHD